MTTDIKKKLNQVFIDFKKQSKDIKPALEYARRLIEIYIDRNFDSRGRWDGKENDITFFSGGSQKWKPLATSTKAKYKKLGYELVATLNRNNSLRSTIGTQLYGSSSILVTANSPYAEIHQKGGTIQHPGGTPYITLGDGLARFISNKKAKQLESKGKSVLRTKPHIIKIPARPYLTITQDELKSLIEYISNFIVK